MDAPTKCCLDYGDGSVDEKPQLLIDASEASASLAVVSEQKMPSDESIPLPPPAKRPRQSSSDHLVASANLADSAAPCPIASKRQLKQKLNRARADLKLAKEALKTALKTRYKTPLFSSKPGVIVDCHDEVQTLTRQVPALRFDLVCHNLRQNNKVYTGNVLLCPDHAAHTLIKGTAHRLGEALMGNTQVTGLALNLETLLPVNGDHIGADIRLPDVEAVLGFINPMIRYLESSTSLVTVELCNSPQYITPHDETLQKAMIEAFLKAIASNPYIQSLQLSRCHILARTFGIFLDSAQLKSLKILFNCLRGARGEMRSGRIACRLESLHLEAETYNIMLALGELTTAATGSTLKELTLCLTATAITPLWESLFPFLRSTTALEQLELWNIEITAEWVMTRLISEFLMVQGDGDNENGPSSAAVQRPNHTISKLLLCNCEFSPEVMDIWVRFLATKTQPMHDGTRTQPMSTLRELHFDVSLLHPRNQVVTTSTIEDALLLQPSTSLEGKDEGALAPTTKQQQTLYCSTAGSQLHTLSLHTYTDHCRAFLAAVVASPERVSPTLTKLQLIRLATTDLDDLFHCIDKIPSLQEVHLPVVARPLEFFPAFFAKRKANGRDCTFCFEDIPAKFRPHIRRAQAYRQRNKVLIPQCGYQSSRLQTQSQQGPAVARAADAPGTNDRLDESTVAPSSSSSPSPSVASSPAAFDLMLGPPMLQASMPVLRHTSQVVLRGLLGYRESIRDFE